MTTAIYAGSFNPITNGHIDIIKSALKIFDRIIIVVANNSEKTYFLPLDLRLSFIKESISDLQNVSVESFSGLITEYAKQKNISALIRGMRSISDFTYELNMAQANYKLSNGNIQTCFIPASPENSYISSSMVREVLINNGNITDFVPKCVSCYFNELRKKSF